MIVRGAVRTDRAVIAATPWAWRLPSGGCPAHPHELRFDAVTGRGSWIWRTQGDSRVRPEHAALDGKVFAAGSSHPTEGEPGDAFNCRCYKEFIAVGHGGKPPTKAQQRAVERATRTAQQVAARKHAKRVAKRRAASASSGSTTRTNSAPPIRTDRAGSRALDVRLDRGAVEQTVEGYLRIEGVAGAGDVLLPYPERGRVEWRSLDELVAAAPTLVGKPITIEHEVDLVTPDNWQAVSHGVVERAWVDGGELRFVALFTTREAIDAIRSGVDKLSLAYRLDPEAARTPITLPDGRTADGQQAGIHFDNLTLTRTPRAGESARLRLDSKGTHTMELLKFTATRTDSTRASGKLPALMLAGLLAASADKGTRTDEDLPVGRLVVEKSDGTAVELTLPDGMLGDVLAMVGAGPAAEAPAEDMPEGEATDELVADEDMPRTDAGRPVLGRLREAVGAAEIVDARLRTDAARRDTEARARPVFGARPMAQLDEAGIMAATVRLAGLGDDKARRADALAATVRATRTDARAAGRALGQLDAMFDEALAAHAANAAKRTDGAPAWGTVLAVPSGSSTRKDTNADARSRMTARRDARTARKAS